MSEERSSKRPSIRESQKASTAKVLLEASEELYVERGYVNTTIGQIAERAGASRATFYLHFDAKWRTVAELVNIRLIPETREFYIRLNAYEELSRDDLRDWLNDALDFYVRHKDMILINLQALQLEPDYAAANIVTTRSFVELVPNLLGALGPERHAEAHLRLALLIMQLTDFAAEWLQGLWEVDRSVVLDVLCDLWMSGLGLSNGVPAEAAGR